MTQEPGTNINSPVLAKLKWFNNQNGFGFLIPENDKGADAFIHVTTLQDAGITALGEGACLLCHIDETSKGAIVKEVVELVDSGDHPVSIPGKSETDQIKNNETLPMEGHVKWFCKDKGFGFVLADDGKKDIFIHQSCLEKAKIDTLEPETRVSMTIRDVAKGHEAVDIEISE